MKQEQVSVAESLKVLTAESRKLEVDTALQKHEIARLETELQKIGQAEGSPIRSSGNWRKKRSSWKQNWHRPRST